jgi:hypothetical protein
MRWQRRGHRKLPHNAQASGEVDGSFRSVRRSGGPREDGIRFTSQQLAEAVSLLTDADEQAINRLIAILCAEGLVQDGDDED